MRVFVYEDIDSFDWERFLPLMPDERQLRTLRYRLNTDRRLCVVSYMLLCKALSITHGIYGQLRFFYGEHGKPYLSDYPNLFFNLSHCNCGVVCAVSDSEVGVDIQPIQPYSEAVAQHVFCTNELEQLNTANNKELEFTKLWTRKEAYLKMLGIGISDNIGSVDTTNIIELNTFILEKSVVSACGIKAEKIERIHF